MSEIHWQDDIRSRERVFSHGKEAIRIPLDDINRTITGDKVYDWHNRLHIVEEEQGVEAPQREEREHPLDMVQHNYQKQLDVLRDCNQQNAPYRSRELSVAITNLETGLLWLKEAPRA